MTKHEWHRWCFAHKDGQRMVFTQQGMPFRIFQPDAVFGGVIEIGGIKCRVRIVRNPNAEKGKRNEVHFPDAEWSCKDGAWTDKVTMEESTLVGYMEITGNWKDGKGRCVFHSIVS